MAGDYAATFDGGHWFYGLRNSAWAGHILLQSDGGAWRIVVSNWGAYACVGKGRNYASSGAWFSLIETLIAMAIGAVLLLGAARFLPALQRRFFAKRSSRRWKMSYGSGSMR